MRSARPDACPGPLMADRPGKTNEATWALAAGLRWRSYVIPHPSSVAVPTFCPKAVRPETSAVGEDVLVRPAEEIEFGPRGEEPEYGLGELGASLALENLVELIL